MDYMYKSTLQTMKWYTNKYIHCVFIIGISEYALFPKLD